MFSFKLVYFKLATHKERLLLEESLRCCDAFIQELRYRYPQKQTVYKMSTDDYPKFLERFSRVYGELHADCEMSDVKAT